MGTKIKGSEHFTVEEFRCRCGCKTPPDIEAEFPKTAAMMEKIRAQHGGKPVNVHCCYRCAKHNAEVGGKPGSKHLKALAVDFDIDGVSPREVAKQAEKISEVGGLEDYSTFTHADRRPRINGKIARWNG